MATNNEFAISVRGLRKSYDGFEAVKASISKCIWAKSSDCSDDGAGKTSTVEILEELRRAQRVR